MKLFSTRVEKFCNSVIIKISYTLALQFAGEFQVTVHPNGFLYIKIPELSYSRGYRRTYLIGVLAKVVVDIARALGKPIALENFKN